ncbi:MAG: hypothetical protein ABI856_16255 [Nitrospira sp.]
MHKVKIGVEYVNDQDGEYWKVKHCLVPTDPNTTQPLASGERYKTKDEAVDEMKRRARAVLGKKDGTEAMRTLIGMFWKVNRVTMQWIIRDSINARTYRKEALWKVSLGQQSLSSSFSSEWSTTS